MSDSRFHESRFAFSSAPDAAGQPLGPAGTLARMPPATSTGPRLFTGFLVLACTALCILVVLLSRENRRLKAAPGPASPPAGAALRPPALKPGDYLAPLTFFDQTGRAFDAAFARPGRRTLILATGGGCPHCATTIPVWNEILDQVGSAAVEVVGLQVEADSIDRLEPTAARFEIHAVRNPRHTWLFALPMVPATILTGPGGEIEHAWFGELTAGQQDELRAALIEASAGGPAPK